MELDYSVASTHGSKVPDLSMLTRSGNNLKNVVRTPEPTKMTGGGI
jgi:hypothetical protein